MEKLKSEIAEEQKSEMLQIMQQEGDYDGIRDPLAQGE